MFERHVCEAKTKIFAFALFAAKRGENEKKISGRPGWSGPKVEEKEGVGAPKGKEGANSVEG